MNGEARGAGAERVGSECLGGLQPVVLVGGRSTRFGRDKLREPVAGGGMLVERGIGALREVFGRRVKVVGTCHPEVSGAADGVIEDAYPGEGPLGGIVSALRELGGGSGAGGAWGVFVLAGDMPGVTEADVRRVAEAALEHAGAWAVVAGTEEGGVREVHPCFGVYRRSGLAWLEARLREGRRRLRTALPAERVVVVASAPGAVRNVNEPGDL